MGGGSWSDASYNSRSSSLKSSGYTSSFTHTSDIKSGKTKKAVHENLNPINIKVRECRDSIEHPNSNAIIVMFDVTGSMGDVPVSLQKKLPQLLGKLNRRNYIADPQILFGAIGDVQYDTVPFQVGQFESDIRADEHLGNIFLEGGGGGNLTESYELSLYFAARKTAVDCWEKRGKKGYLFTIGDENISNIVFKDVIKKVFGDNLQDDISTSELMREVQQKYNVFHIIPGGTSHYGTFTEQWKKLYGAQNVILLENPDLVTETIVSIIASYEGTDSVASALSDCDKVTVNTVSKALSNVSVKSNVPSVKTNKNLMSTNLDIE